MTEQEGQAAPAEERKGGISLHSRILLGLVAGAAIGVTVNLMTGAGWIQEATVESILHYVTRPLGLIFLNMLFMVVVPLVFCSLSLGVTNLGQGGKLGRLALRTFGYFLLTSAVSAALGLLLVNVFRPGEGFDPETQARLMSEFGSQAPEREKMTGFSVDMFVSIVSRNPIGDMAESPPKMLPIIFFAIIFGIALTRIRGELAASTIKVLEGVGDAMVTIVGFAMQLAPFAVPALIFNVTAVLGWQVIKQLALFVALAFVGYLVQLFGTYSVLLRVFAHYSPRSFFRKVVPVMVTAFSTSSSNATLPTSIKHTEEDLGVPSHIAGFVLPLGATANMNGTALFEGVVVLFIAQVFGVHLSLVSQALVVVLAVLTAVGAAGIPGGSIPLLVGVLEAVGLPGGSIALIIGVDRLLDMGRTVVNVTGDVTAACYIAASENYPLKD